MPRHQAKRALSLLRTEGEVEAVVLPTIDAELRSTSLGTQLSKYVSSSSKTQLISSSSPIVQGNSVGCHIVEQVLGQAELTTTAQFQKAHFVHLDMPARRIRLAEEVGGRLRKSHLPLLTVCYIILCLRRRHRRLVTLC